MHQHLTKDDIRPGLVFYSTDNVTSVNFENIVYMYYILSVEPNSQRVICLVLDSSANLNSFDYAFGVCYVMYTDQLTYDDERYYNYYKLISLEKSVS